jgi:hypothetical protein
MVRPEGRSHHTRERRPILGLAPKENERRTENSSLLAGAEHFFTTKEVEDAQRWGAALWAARNAWDIARRQKGKSHG